jgi:predicted RNA-binding protein YlqC (UPF0109 family)
MAATIAVAQYDVKAVLAYSTISQLGFMVAAIGLGAYVAAAFHLITHAFFKALLFLGSGSVIHALEVGAADMGKIIGRQGNTAKAIRTLLRVVGMKNNSRVNLKINEPVGGLKSPERMAEEAPAVPLSTPNSKTVEEAMADLKLE